MSPNTLAPDRHPGDVVLHFPLCEAIAKQPNPPNLAAHDWRAGQMITTRSLRDEADSSSPQLCTTNWRRIEVVEPEQAGIGANGVEVRSNLYVRRGEESEILRLKDRDKKE
jgi:hypothetical protein